MNGGRGFGGWVSGWERWQVGGRLGGWGVCLESKKMCLGDIHIYTDNFGLHILGNLMIFNF